jgi:peptide/nickel transport system substrate-binding protein
MIWVKPTGYLAQQEARLALSKAINRDLITKSAYGLGATTSVSSYPNTMAGGTTATDPYAYDPSVLTAYVKNHPASSIVVGFATGAAADNLAAQLIQTELQAAGLTATVRGYGMEIYNFPTSPSKAPDLMVLTVNSDAASPSTFLHEYLATGGPLTLNAASVPAADDALAAGVSATDSASATAQYVDAARAYSASGDFISVADVQSVIYARKSVGNVGWTGANPFGPIYATTGTA